MDVLKSYASQTPPELSPDQTNPGVQEASWLLNYSDFLY